MTLYVHDLAAHLYLKVTPEPAALRATRERVRSFLSRHRQDQAVIEDIVLSVQEALKNAVRFAGSPEVIELDLRLSRCAIEVTVKDAGVGFDPVPDVGELTAPDCDALSGRGLHIIACLNDELELSNDGGARVRLVKHLTDGHAF